MSFAQNVSANNSRNWRVSGILQPQYLLNKDIENDSSLTNSGFRIRRARIKLTGDVNDWIKTIIQVEVRDNDPRIEDAEGQITLSKRFYIRFGQFKVPVWREELRSAGKLLLIERSAVADFLTELNLAGRQVGIEIGGQTRKGIIWAFNLSNGSGPGTREDAGTPKEREFVNNGKLISARLNIPVSHAFHLGISGASNRVGAEPESTGRIKVFSTDFRLNLRLSPESLLEFEGGTAFGNGSGNLDLPVAGKEFHLYEISGRWSKHLVGMKETLGGLDGVEFAAGLSFVEPDIDTDNDESWFYRMGPAVYFGRQTRIQLNGEVENPTAPDMPSVFRLRLQSTFNF